MNLSSRIRILQIYQILLKHSDVEHKLTKKDIARYLAEDYQISVSPNTLSDDMRDLLAAGINIEVHRGIQNQYHFAGQEFDIAEIRLLADAVNSSRFITKRLSDAMIDKLLQQVTDITADEIRDNLGTGSYIKSENKQVHYIVDVINNAIARQMKIRFVYRKYDPDKTLREVHDGRPYIISPYSLRWDGEFYYLIGFDERERKNKTFRIDRIKTKPEILSEKSIPPDKDFDADKYTQMAFQMLDSDTPPVEVSVLCKNNLMGYVIDNFGITVNTDIVDDQHFKFTAIVYPSSTFFRWIFGWNGEMKILGPEEVIEKYREMVDAARGTIDIP